MTHDPHEDDPPWTTGEDTAAARRRHTTTADAADRGEEGTLDTPGVEAGGTQEERGVRRFNEAEHREGPAWVDRPGGGFTRPRSGTSGTTSSPAENPTSPSGEPPLEEVTPEDLPEVGEPYAQPGAPFEVQGPDRP